MFCTELDTLVIENFYLTKKTTNSKVIKKFFSDKIISSLILLNMLSSLFLFLNFMLVKTIYLGFI